MALLYEELTYAIRGCIYDVHNGLGTGFDEESYQLALEQRLTQSNIPFRSQEIGYVEHRGKRVHKFVLDLIVDDVVILELKTIQTNFHPANIFQTLSYLKCWKKELGLLVNFGLPKAAIKRILNTEKEETVLEDYAYIKAIITPITRKPLKELRASLLTIFETHGLGYEVAIYEALLLQELAFRKIKFTPQTIIPVKYEGQFVKNYEIQWPIIDNQFLCGIAVRKEDIKLDIIKIQTYLKALQLPIGLLAHFGKEKLEIYGIVP